MRVIAAMSGGVDSSVAAARMVDAGHDVVGRAPGAVSHPAPRRQPGRVAAAPSTTPRDARRVADQLGIPFYVWDLSERFRDDVIADFVDEYRNGRTPNPCLRCNEKIKFSAVLDRALAMDFDVVATGHYARIVHGPHGPELHRAVDPAKDQSYVLGVLTAEQLAHSAFPLGDDVKDVVRDEAERRGLLVARKPDSHDICFIPDGDTAALRPVAGSARLPATSSTPSTGEVLAHHEGAHAFTIGQRRGLNLRVPCGRRRPEVRRRRRHRHEHRAGRPARAARRRRHRGHPGRVGRTAGGRRARGRARHRCERTAFRYRRAPAWTATDSSSTS